MNPARLFKKWMIAVLLLLFSCSTADALIWSDAQELEVRGMLRDHGFYLVLQKVLRGQAFPETLRPWVDRVNEPSLVGTTVRDTLASLPPSTTPWVENLLKNAPPGTEKDWVLARRKDPNLVSDGKFNLSLYPVRMDLLPGVSLVLPNYDWSISFQDDHQMTVQALERGYSGTVHMRWIDPAGADVFDTARLVQMYAGFQPRYIVKKPTGEFPVESDLVPITISVPKVMTDRPGVLEQVQVGAPDAWQLYVGRTRWYRVGDKVLVVMLNVHIEENQRLADRDRTLAKVGLLLDTLRIVR